MAESGHDESVEIHSMNKVMDDVNTGSGNDEDDFEKSKMDIGEIKSEMIHKKQQKVSCE